MNKDDIEKLVQDKVNERCLTCELAPMFDFNRNMQCYTIFIERMGEIELSLHWFVVACERAGKRPIIKKGMFRTEEEITLKE